MRKRKGKSFNVTKGLSITALPAEAQGGSYYMRVRAFATAVPPLSTMYVCDRDNFDDAYLEAVKALIKVIKPRRVKKHQAEMLAMQPDWDHVLDEMGIKEETRYVYK